ncbi:MAG: glycosyltransferase family 4 protein [Rhodothermales bacterium]|nr:glycosyltransferase family 4 protein [Rhodothermales bacterium]
MPARTLNVLLVHNYYQQSGGEDRMFEAEGSLLESRGHRVRRFTAHNDVITGLNQFSVAAKSVWNRRTTRDLNRLLKHGDTDVVHFHNTLPLVSPSAYYAAKRSGAAVVQTLHNYRLFCPKSVLMRDGHVCEECIGQTFAWPAVKYGCYRNSKPATTVVATMLYVHNRMDTWNQQIDVNIALTNFARDKYIEGGLDPARIVVKPHFVESHLPPGSGNSGGAVFVGRLSDEKGIRTLLEAWSDEEVGMPIEIVGDGPLAGEVERAAAKNELITWRGRLSSVDVFELVRESSVLIAPSECYETFGRVVIESFSLGTPVIVSDIGAIGELVEHGRTGYKFQPGNARELRQRVIDFAAATESQQEMREAVILEHASRYTADINYPLLMDVYDRAIKLNASA